MLSLDARFTLLLFFCGLSTQWISITSVSAAAISLPPQARRSSIQNGEHRYQDGTQRFLPWSAGQPYPQRNSVYDKRMPEPISNPFANFAHSVLFGIRKKMHHHNKRSPHQSIVIPSNRGGAYVLPHPRREPPLWRVGVPKQRDVEEGIPGTVGITSHVDGANNSASNGDRLIAYLSLANGTDVLNASDTNKMQFYLVNAPSSTSRDPMASDNKAVMLVMSSPPDSPPYCATFDPNPSGAKPMTVQPCLNANATDANTPAHSSQIFMYNTASGRLNPTASLGQDDDTHDTTSAQDAPSDDSDWTSTYSPSASASAPAFVNATDTATTAQVSSTSLSTRADQDNTQNVALVFIPAGSAAAAEANDNIATSSAVSTSTIWQSYTASASGSISAAYVTPSTDTSTSTSTSSAAFPSQSAGGLDVELVGDGSLPASSWSSSPSPSASAGSYSSTMTSVPMASSSVPARGPESSASKSVDAGAIASRIASSASVKSGLRSWSYSASPSAFVASASASYTASSSIPWASPSLSAAGFSPSGNSDSLSASVSASVSASSVQASSTDTQASGTFVAAVEQRNAPVMTPVSTAPYQWKFRAESR